MYSKSLYEHVPVRDDRMLERYLKLIEHHVKNPHNGLGEDHHILPVSLGGEYYQKVRLSHRAHYVAHWMLHKAIGGKMTAAFHYMIHNKRYPDSRITSRVFAVLREENSKHLSESMMGENNPMYGISQKPSAETRKKISEATKGENNPMYGISNKASAETRKKISEATKGEKNGMYGKKASAETRKKIGEAHKGKVVSDEARKNMSESAKLAWKKRKARAIA